MNFTNRHTHRLVLGLRFLITLLLLTLLACGGGGSDDEQDQTNSVPQLSHISANKTSLNVSVLENSSFQLILSLNFDDQTSDTHQLDFDWDKETQKFVISAQDSKKYQLDLVEQDDKAKLLRITELESEKMVDVDLVFDTGVVLIDEITLTLDDTELQVGEAVTPILDFSYSNGESSSDIPENVSCTIVTGEAVVSIGNDCVIAAIEVGEAQISLSFPDDLLAENIELPVVTIAVVETPDTVVPVVSRLSVSAEKNTLIVGESINLSVLAHYDDQSNKDVTAEVTCESVSGEAQVNIENCVLLAVTAGVIEVGAQFNDGQSSELAVETIKFTVDDPALQITSLQTDVTGLALQSSVDAEKSVILTRLYNDESSDTVDLLIAWQYATQSFEVTDAEQIIYASVFDPATGLLTVTEPESQLSIELNVAINLIDTLQFEVAELSMLSGETLPLNVSAIFKDGKEVIFNEQVICSKDEAADNYISVSQDCSIIAWFPGVYTIYASLKNPLQASNNFQAQALQLTVNPLNLGSLTDKSLFSLDKRVDSSAIAFEIEGATVDEIYKVTLTAMDVDLPLSSTALNVLPVWTYGQGCKNFGVVAELSVACGVQATQDKIYIFLEEATLANLAQLNYSLTVEPDADILTFDGNSSANPHKVITVGTTYTGHVPANGHEYNNLSLYKTDILNGMDEEGGDYLISVIFKSRFYQEDSVVVRWDSKDLLGTTIFECSDDKPVDFVTKEPIFILKPEALTIECIVSNRELPQNIEIEVYGNGRYFLPNVFNSLTAVDGEVEYDVVITQP